MRAAPNSAGARCRWREYFVYDVELHLAGSRDNAFSFVTMQPTSEYLSLFEEFRRQLYLWLGSGLLVLLALLWLGLDLGLSHAQAGQRRTRPGRSGQRERLSDDHPRELLRLTRSLNRLLDSERRQREQYRNPGRSGAQPENPAQRAAGRRRDASAQSQSREQAQVMQAQIERMSQQIGYQLQRASLGKSGLVRHRVELRSLLDSLCSTLDKVYRDKRVQIDVQLVEPCVVPMEQGALMELLGNLLENAYRLCLGRSASAPARMTATCCWASRTTAPACRWTSARIIRRGERLDAQHPGQGIGLAVVRTSSTATAANPAWASRPWRRAAFQVRLRAD